ncbi:MAG TPA: germination protein YpeB [Firmicutes bacterium]|jgi:germination protein YpeB|nr:hypothetical protein [Bacillota bacterium]MDK2926721.1 hypothetical protein [Bacillota bacterium]HHV57509.1 germination protein YpeB [Bacillota bacterium]
MQRSRWLTVGVVLALLTGGIWFWNYNLENTRARNSLEAGYQRALFSLVGHVQNLNTLLAKGQVTQDNGQGVLTLASAWHEAESARTSLSQLPLGRFDLTAAQRYLAQVGDYSYTLARKLALGQPLSTAEQDNLAALSKETGKLNKDLQKMIGGLSSKPAWGTTGVTVGLKGKPVAPAGSIADGLAKVDSRLKDEAPTLTYDGPFSEHMENIKPRGVTGKPVTIEQAGRIAEEFVNRGGAARYTAVSSRRVAGAIPAYSITLRPQGGRRLPDITVDVSQTGGHVVYFLNPRPLGPARLDVGEAVRRAEDFVRARGYKDMLTTGSLRRPNNIVVTQAWTQDGAVAYPDFVKATVALDTGEIVGFDARGYLTSHRRRDLPQARFSAPAAREKAAGRMTVDRVRAAIIPMSDASERYCWEVRGRANGQTFLVYYNATDGQEEKILQVIESPDGTYTM